ncbi:MAG: hypothetical protein ACK4ZM_04065 [bacterium]
MNPESSKSSKEIENLILSIKENIKVKNYGQIASQILTLNNLILTYLLALDYEVRSLQTSDLSLSKVKEIVNLNLQRIKEYLQTKDENLINEVQDSLSQIYNVLFEPQEIQTPKWTDLEEQKFFQVLQQISELSNKIYLYYSKKNLPFEEILNLSQNLISNIEKLPRK